MDGIKDTTKNDLVEEVTSTTTFIDSGVEKMIEMKSDFNSSYKLVDQGLSAFMSKPILVRNFLWTSASALNSVIATVSAGTELLANTIWMNKISGYNLVRGTACIKIMANASPFQSGRLLLHYLPSNLSADTISLHNTNITTKSTQPGVELDLRDTTCVFKVPYVGPANYFAMTDLGGQPAFDWGTFFMSVIYPISTGIGGENSVNLSVYLWFEDFELAAPIYQPQSNVSGKKSRGKRMSAIVGEGDVESGKPISSALATASHAVSILGNIPLLSSIAGPTSWALNLASGVASAFGWSKPLNNTTASYLVNQPMRYSATSDGGTNAMPLALICDNKLSISDCLSGRLEDEMSFDFLKTVPALISPSNVWSSSAAQGDSLYNLSIRPSNLTNVISTAVGGRVYTANTGPPIYTLSPMFKYWRGSIIMRISFIKTAFHSGRIQVVFTPNSNGGNPVVSPTLAESTLSLRTIIDVRETSNVEIVLPYLMAKNYLAQSERSGMVAIRVLNQLRSPPTVSQAIGMVISYRGGPDFEFQAVNGTTSVAPFLVYPQANLFTYADYQATSGVPLDNSVDVSYSEQTIGEHFKSVRQLLTRMCPLLYTSTFPGVISASNTTVAYWPWHSTLLRPGATAIGSSSMGTDTYSFIAPMYAFYKGSMVVSFINGTGFSPNGVWIDNSPYTLAEFTTAPFTTKVVPNTIGATDTLASTRANYAGVGYAQVVDANIGRNVTTSGFSIPFQNDWNCGIISPGGVSPSSSEPETRLRMFNAGSTATFTPAGFIRSVGDDFQFSFFIGTVPLLVDYV